MSSPLPSPPAQDPGIDIDETDHGPRVVLPRHFTPGDVIIAALAGAITAFLAVWLDALQSRGTTEGLAMAFMAVVALGFAALALTQGFRIAARRTLERRGNALVLGWKLGARAWPRHRIPIAAITAVDRGMEIRAGEGLGPEELRILAGSGEWRVGAGLSGEGVAWLEAVVRRWVGPAGLQETAE